MASNWRFLYFVGYSLWLAYVAVLCVPESASAAFGITSESTGFTVDTGAGLVFRVAQGSGEIASIIWEGTELNGPKNSGLASGFGDVNVTPTAVADLIVLTCTTDAGHAVIPNLTHYFVVQKGVNNIYMATHAPEGCKVGELRWITRLKEELLTSTPIHSDLRGTNGPIESKDVFGTAGGISRSKYYGNQRAKDLSIRGISGPGRGVFMAYGNRETSSGGPFYRDIQNQSAEVYNYMSSGHGWPDVARNATVHGPYALCFTTGGEPTVPEMSFMSTLGLVGYVGPAARGNVACCGIAGMNPRHDYTISFSGSAGQYWTTPHAANGSFAMWGMLPGDYTLKVYKNELAVYQKDTVTVTAGRKTIVDSIKIADDPSAVEAIWRIGDWDGSPLEFLNGDKINFMHPSDKRMACWNPGPYRVGGSTPSKAMQACQWMDVEGNSKIIEFDLSTGQLKDSKLRIGISCAFNGARPLVSVNSFNAPAVGPSLQPTSRTLTLGTYRGNNVTFTFFVPARALVAGKNIVRFGPLSGTKGGGYLSPGYSLDCIDFSQ